MALRVPWSPVTFTLAGMPVRDPCSDLPSPWTRRVIHFVGGLTGVGFSPDSTNLLVVSHAGRGVVSLASSELVARDGGEIPDAEFREEPFAVVGIGPLRDTWIECTGLFDGFELKQVCGDGWRINAEVLVSPRGKSYPLPVPDDPVRAVGFDPDDKVLVYATSASLSLYYRAS